jgi:hypothetical protein
MTLPLRVSDDACSCLRGHCQVRSSALTSGHLLHNQPSTLSSKSCRLALGSKYVLQRRYIDRYRFGLISKPGKIVTIVRPYAHLRMGKNYPEDSAPFVKGLSIGKFWLLSTGHRAWERHLLRVNAMFSRVSRSHQYAA